MYLYLSSIQICELRRLRLKECQPALPQRIPSGDTGFHMIIKAGDATPWRGMTVLRVTYFNNRSFWSAQYIYLIF